MPIHIYIANITQILRRASNAEDPRCVFYQAVLASETFEQYIEKVGSIVVTPSTYLERMGANREFKYMRDDRQWLRTYPYAWENGKESTFDDFQPDPENDARQRVVRTVIRRQGQLRFRRELLQIYGGRCAISGCSVVPLLEAAHVTPYLGQHTNSLQNGILLRADIHSLWDQGFVAIDPKKRTVWVSPSIVQHDSMYGALHGVPVRDPTPANLMPSEACLQTHWSFISGIN